MKGAKLNVPQCVLWFLIWAKIHELVRPASVLRSDFQLATFNFLSQRLLHLLAGTARETGRRGRGLFDEDERVRLFEAG